MNQRTRMGLYVVLDKRHAQNKNPGYQPYPSIMRETEGFSWAVRSRGKLIELTGQGKSASRHRLFIQASCR